MLGKTKEIIYDWQSYVAAALKTLFIELRNCSDLELLIYQNS